MPYVIDLLKSRDEGPGGTIVPSCDINRHAEGSKLKPAFAAHGRCDHGHSYILLIHWQPGSLVGYDRGRVVNVRDGGDRALLVDCVAERCRRGPLGDFGYSGVHDTGAEGAITAYARGVLVLYRLPQNRWVKA